MQAGDIVFVTHDGPVDNLIRYFDKGKFSHVCMFVNDTQIVEAQYNTIVHIVDYPFDSPEFTTEVVSLHLTGDQKAKLQGLADQYLGESYDYGDIFLIWLRLETGIDLEQFRSKDEQICSELIAHILIGLGLAEERTLEMTPNELYRYLKSKGY